MVRESSRRAVLGAVLAGGVGGVAASSVGDLMAAFAPLSGRAWRGRRRTVPDTVSSPHGDATITYDEYHVPHVEADEEAAAYFAVGYVQAADRLFEMDLIRRRMAGRLSAAFGERTVASDVFHAKMDFRGGAEASAEALAGTRTASLVRAYADGVNAYREAGPAPFEFDLLGYEAAEWGLVDTLLVGQQIAWGLTGSFDALRRDVLRSRLDRHTYRRLFDAPFDHGAPILRNGRGPNGHRDGSATRGPSNLDPTFVDWLRSHAPPGRLGSNHWAVAGEHTESGSPILAYDPHLPLMVPPVWYEQRVVVGDIDVRGATFPGLPFVVIGENAHGAWGFTNTGADVVDLYTYRVDEDRYRYRGEWRDFERREQEIPVAGGEDRRVTVRKTVHGAFVDRELDGDRRHVGVAWTGMTGTREAEAIYEFSRAADVDDFAAALRRMDVPTQNALWVDDESVYYKIAGRIPVRRVGGEVIRGDRVFDGSAGEAEWAGFTPFGQSSWDGFVPFDAKPGVRDPPYIATANQRPVDDPAYPIGQEYASGFRARRLYERLDRRVRSDEPVDPAFMRSLQSDTVDLRARMLVPALLQARERLPSRAAPWLDAMETWDFRMDRESPAALAFDRFYEAFRAATWRDEFSAMGFDESWWPQEWVLVTLPADSRFFDGDREGTMVEAMRTALDRLEAEDAAVYGDVNRTSIDHPFGSRIGALNYPRLPTDGSAVTVFNVHEGATTGSSWRQVSPMVGESVSVIPGGQDGSYFSPHYDDQLSRWADGEYKPMRFAVPPDGETIHVRGGPR